MSLFQPPEGLTLLLPHEKAYERIYEKNTPKEITEKLLPTILHESLFFPISVYGHRLFHCSQTLEKGMHATKEPKLPVRAIFASTDENYVIKEMLGPRTYRVLGRKVNKERVLKMEWTGRPATVPMIQGTLSVLQKVKETLEMFPKCEFFSSIIAYHVAGVFQDKFAYYVTDLYDSNLQDMLYKTLQGSPISRNTALHIAIETLRGIHDLHLIRYMHRDIKPSNFYIGRAGNYRKIYIGGLNASYNYFDKKLVEEDCVLGKVRSINARFQCRHYHTSDPFIPVDDIESWIYMIIYFFNPEKLPWRFVKSERIGYEYKCSLVNGAFELGEIEYFMRQLLNFMNFQMTKTLQDIDFGYLCAVLSDMAIQWKFKPDCPLDWEADPKTGKCRPAKNDDKNVMNQPITKIKDIREDLTKTNASQATKTSSASRASKAVSKANPKDSMVTKKSTADLKPLKKVATVEETQYSPSVATSKAVSKAKANTKAKKKPEKTQEQTTNNDEGNGMAISKAKISKPLSKTAFKSKELTKDATEEKDDSGSPKNDANMS